MNKRLGLAFLDFFHGFAIIKADNMANFDTYLFSKNERKLLKILPTEGARPRNLMRKGEIPHASLYLAFNHLCARGMARRDVRDGKLYWKRIGIFGGAYAGKRGETEISIHTDTKSVRACIEQIFALPAGSRFTVVEGTQEDSGWFELFSKSETIRLNEMLAEKKIICENVLPESYFKDALPRLGKDWALSYKTRPIVTYIIKRSLIPSSALLLVLPSKVILLYAKEMLAIEIKNIQIIALIKGMAEVIKDTAKKVSIAEDFSFKETV